MSWLTFDCMEPRLQRLWCNILTILRITFLCTFSLSIVFAFADDHNFAIYIFTLSKLSTAIFLPFCRVTPAKIAKQNDETKTEPERSRSKDAPVTTSRSIKPLIICYPTPTNPFAKSGVCRISIVVSILIGFAANAWASNSMHRKNRK